MNRKHHNQTVIEQMVLAYSNQDLESIYSLFCPDAVYQDMRGFNVMGKTIRGSDAICKHFSFYFKYLMPSHTYKNSSVFTEGDKACASWTLVLGADLPEERQFQLRGCDYFLLENGLVKEKCAFLKSNWLMVPAIIRIHCLEKISGLLAGLRRQVESGS